MPIGASFSSRTSTSRVYFSINSPPFSGYYRVVDEPGTTPAHFFILSDTAPSHSSIRNDARPNTFPCETSTGQTTITRHRAAFHTRVESNLGRCRIPILDPSGLLGRTSLFGVPGPITKLMTCNHFVK